MNHTRKTNQSTTKSLLPRAARMALAVTALSLGACSAFIAHPKPTASWTQRNGQVKFSSAGTNVVGDIVIRHDADNFLAEISKGPGVVLLTISAKYGNGGSKVLAERHAEVIKATGPLSKGGWIWRPASLAKGKESAYAKLKDSSRAWAALPEVFQWGQAQAKGEEFRVCFPDVTMHSKTRDGELERFDYRRLENTNKVASLGELTPKDLKKLPVLETVIVHLDK